MEQRETEEEEERKRRGGEKEGETRIKGSVTPTPGGLQHVAKLIELK